jgi:uncharacterized protein YggE
MNTLKEKEYIISITGYARIFVKPNYFTINISIEDISVDMDIARNSVNEDMTSLFRLVESIGINKKEVNVVDLSFEPKYEWVKNTNKFIGYKVEQQVIIEMDATTENEEKAKKLVSRITGVLHNLSQCQINYALRNKKDHLSKVRELSFLDALAKAEQYAKLAGVKIVGTNTISDIEPIAEYSRHNSYDAGPNTEIDDNSYLPTGQKIVLENKVFVTFDIGKKNAE